MLRASRTHNAGALARFVIEPSTPGCDSFIDSLRDGSFLEDCLSRMSRLRCFYGCFSGRRNILCARAFEDGFGS